MLVKTHPYRTYGATLRRTFFVRSIIPPISMATAKEVSSKPEKVFRLRGISVSVFANTTTVEKRKVTFRKVSLQRSYRDESGEWQTTTGFGRDDLPTVQLLLKRAWEFILDTEANRSHDEAAE
jgi:hypothetical protein